MSIFRDDPLGKVKLKHAWILTLLVLFYVVYYQGWPSPALEKLMLDAVQVWIGAIIGYGIDTVHFWFAKPQENDTTPANRNRRTALIIAGMVAFSL